MACSGECKPIHKGIKPGCGNPHYDEKGSYWTCTQPKDHKGDHIACNSSSCNLKSWPPVSFKTAAAPAAVEEKFDLTLSPEEAKVLMSICGQVISGDTARGKLMHGIYYALNKAGVSGLIPCSVSGGMIKVADK